MEDVRREVQKLRERVEDLEKWKREVIEREEDDRREIIRGNTGLRCDD